MCCPDSLHIVVSDVRLPPSTRPWAGSQRGQSGLVNGSRGRADIGQQSGFRPRIVPRCSAICSGSYRIHRLQVSLRCECIPVHFAVQLVGFIVDPPQQGCQGAGRDFVGIAA